MIKQNSQGAAKVHYVPTGTINFVSGQRGEEMGSLPTEKQNQVQIQRKRQIICRHTPTKVLDYQTFCT